MAANTSPIFLKQPRVSFVATGTSANTSFDGTGTVATAFTADATNGSRIDEVYVWHLGTNTATTVVRFFVNNGSTNATVTNNTLVYEATLNNYTASQVARQTDSVVITWKPNLVLPAGYKLNVTIGTALQAGAQVTCIGGDY